MPEKTHFKALYSDIGGVLGTNGWDSGVRARICERFGLDPAKIDARHRLMFDSFERGYVSFETYATRVFFNTPRDFVFETLREFAYAQSIPWPENIDLIRTTRIANNLKLGLISNEGEGITQNRIERFGLRELADFMVISHCVHMRKPDPAIWHLALDLAGVHASESIYIDDRPLFAEIAGSLGFAAIHHVSVDRTRESLRLLGLFI